MAMVVMGGMFFQSITALRKILFWCCNHGDGSDGRHVCTKYRGHTYYYQQPIGCYIGNGALVG